MGVKFQTKEMERTKHCCFRFKSQKVMKYNFKQKRLKKRKNLLYPFKTPGWIKLDKGEQNGRCEGKQIAVRLKDS